MRHYTQYPHHVPASHQPCPPDNTDAYIRLHVARWAASAATGDPIHVHPEVAWEIAAQWHSPSRADEPIATFSHTGRITEDLKMALEATLKSQQADTPDVLALRALIAFVEAATPAVRPVAAGKELITARDIRDQVIHTLTGQDAEFDVDGIVAAIVERYGLIHIDDVPDATYWEIVRDHARAETFLTVVDSAHGHRFMSCDGCNGGTCLTCGGHWDLIDRDGVGHYVSSAGEPADECSGDTNRIHGYERYCDCPDAQTTGTCPHIDHDCNCLACR